MLNEAQTLWLNLNLCILIPGFLVTLYHMTGIGKPIKRVLAKIKRKTAHKRRKTKYLHAEPIPGTNGYRIKTR